MKKLQPIDEYIKVRKFKKDDEDRKKETIKKEHLKKKRIYKFKDF